LIESLITSKTRVKLLLKFFLNPNTRTYLRALEQEFGESTNAIRLELNRLENANMLVSEIEGNKKVFQVNRHHPLFHDINGIVKKYFGIHVIIEKIIKKLGDIEQVILTGELAEGKDVSIIDIIIIGEVDHNYLNKLIEKAEGLIKRRVRYIVMSMNEFLTHKEENTENILIIWDKE